MGTTKGVNIVAAFILPCAMIRTVPHVTSPTMFDLPAVQSCLTLCCL